MLVWLITGKSESGDKMFPRVYKHKPTEEEIKTIVADLNETEDLDDTVDHRDGPGDYGSYWFLDVKQIEVVE